ncbi:hypothetical protein SDB63_21390, partial [Brucella sp. NBRC 113783]|nr:hypothetical protein [Brucella sp. NBRC 113783]
DPEGGVRTALTFNASTAVFETPQGRERRQRHSTVLEVVCLIFNEGYMASECAHWLVRIFAMKRCASGARLRH